MTDLLQAIGEAIELLGGPYGVTWGVDDHYIAQTGFVFSTPNEAYEAGLSGPWAMAQVTQVDPLCEHYPKDEGVQIWTIIEDEAHREVINEFWCEGGPVD